MQCRVDLAIVVQCGLYGAKYPLGAGSGLQTGVEGGQSGHRVKCTLQCSLCSVVRTKWNIV